MQITPLHHWIATKLGVKGSALTRELIQNYQLHKLKQTLAVAVQHSPFYRKKLTGWPKLTSLADVKHLPFTTAEDIRGNPLHFLCVSQDQINRVVTLRSSGTTGAPKRVFFTKADQELTIDFFHIGMSTLVGPGDRVLILLPGELTGSVGDLLARALTRLGARGIPQGLVADPAQTLAIIQAAEVNSLVGIPSQVLALARYRDERGRRVPLGLKSVLLSTDYVPQAIRRELEQNWGCPVFNHYGMTEMGLGGGVECAALAGYHLREADLYFEMIDPISGELVPDGKMGEIVFTTLTRQGMPLIRYRTGDWARFLPEPCPCGTSLRSMGLVVGRVKGACGLAGGALTMAELDEVLFGVPGLLNYEASLTCFEGTDRLTIGLKMVGGVDDRGLAEIKNALAKLPVIERSISQGCLELHLSILPDQMVVSTAKRCLNDLRK
ncbi:DVU_1553 family AMP-dependent CoA ligase [Desulfotomaculum sp. 1211_IL3151]|uniref:DVU_1553 family AMP-dependent CoA ligase n=1 Tax=Desulfotomaculum sp. 1211_IL3151 TaxID=3084055 RepID=UPI002FD8FA66